MNIIEQMEIKGKEFFQSQLPQEVELVEYHYDINSNSVEGKVLYNNIESRVALNVEKRTSTRNGLELGAKEQEVGRALSQLETHLRLG